MSVFVSTEQIMRTVYTGYPPDFELELERRPKRTHNQAYTQRKFGGVLSGYGRAGS